MTRVLPCKICGCFPCLPNCGNAPLQVPRRGNAPFSPDTKSSNPKDTEAVLDNRVDLSLVPDTAVVALAMAFIEGDAKYGGHNYRIAGVRASTYAAAEERHMKAWRNGEDIDPDSGLPHLWKALACIAVLIDAIECRKLTDDRPPRAPVAEMLKRLRSQVAAIRQSHASRTGVRRFTIADSEPEAPDHWLPRNGVGAIEE